MRRMLLASLISAIYGYIPHTIGNNPLAWDLYEICTHVKFFTWAMVLTSFIPYNQLAAKSIGAVIAASNFINIFYFLFWRLSLSDIGIYSIKVSVCVGVFFYIWWKDYDRGSDVLDEFHFFKVGIRPVSLQDFLLSLIRDPVGGVGIYVRNEFYHYRHGELVIHDRRYVERLSKKYKVKRMRRFDAKRYAILKKLEGSKYSKWSWIWNCKTVLEPILGRRGKPLFYKRRSLR